MYKEQNLKELLPNMTIQEQYEKLSEHGMLIKRPILIHESIVLVGFKENEWLNVLLEKQ